MGLFDFIPTMGEVFEFIGCRMGDHEWTYGETDNGVHYRFCVHCKKRESLE